MFGKFGGIVIIALSIAIVAGLILRSVPEHPAALSLGISDSKVVPEGSTEAPAPETMPTAEATADAVDKTEQAVSDKLNEAKEAMTDKAEAVKSETMESITETVTGTVESANEVVGTIKETVEKQLETKSE